MNATVRSVLTWILPVLIIGLAERARAEEELPCPTVSYAQKLGPMGWQLVCGSAGCPPGYQCRAFVSIEPIGPSGLLTVTQRCGCARWDAEHEQWELLAFDNSLCTVILQTTFSGAVAVVVPACQTLSCQTLCVGPELSPDIQEYRCSCQDTSGY